MCIIRIIQSLKGKLTLLWHLRFNVITDILNGVYNYNIPLMLINIGLLFQRYIYSFIYMYTIAYDERRHNLTYSKYVVKEQQCRKC